jgi:hypothetical protein
LKESKKGFNGLAAYCGEIYKANLSEQAIKNGWMDRLNSRSCVAKMGLPNRGSIANIPSR